MVKTTALPLEPVMAARADLIAERTRRRVTRRLLPYLLLLYLIAYIDRTNIGVAKLQMQGELQFTDAIVGFGAGIFFLGYFLLEIPGTLIVERWSARKWIARIMISWGIVASLMGFIGTPWLSFIDPKWQFYSFRFLLGLAEAGFFPGVVVYLSHWFRAEDRARAKARFMIGIPISTVIGVPLSRAILEHVHWGGLPGWRWVYILEGMPAVLFGVVTIFYLTDRPEQARWLPEEEKQWLVSTLAQERNRQASAGRADLRAAFRHPQILLLALIYFLGTTSSYGLTFFLPSITENMKGLSITGRTVVTTLPYLCMLSAMLWNGRSSDRWGERRWHTAIPYLIFGVGLMASVLAGEHVALAILFLCLAGSGNSAHPAFWTLPSAFLTGSAAAAAVGLINSIGNLGGFIGPYAVGYLKTHTGNFRAAVFLLGGSALLAGLLATRLKPPVHQKPDQPRNPV
jgi:ACS family tartrate transporter-like MFS transporter